MKFHELGNKNRPHIMLIHGGGNAWWNYLRQAEVLSNKYHVILPTLDGHGEEYETTYISTEDTADKLISYIDENCSGHLFALCGVSLGGQIESFLSFRFDLGFCSIYGFNKSAILLRRFSYSLSLIYSNAEEKNTLSFLWSCSFLLKNLFFFCKFPYFTIF